MYLPSRHARDSRHTHHNTAPEVEPQEGIRETVTLEVFVFISTKSGALDRRFGDVSLQPAGQVLHDQAE